DLRTLREWTEQRGGGFLLVNPLHAVAPVLPLEASPYLPATRRFRNPVYLCLDDVPGFAALDASSDTPPTPRPGVIDRDGAWLHKLHLLRAVFAERPTTSDNESVDGFDAWRADQGSALEEFATWSMLAEQHGADWHDWPQPLHDPRGDAVAAAAAEKSVEVDFQAWLQWLLAGQLEAASGDLTVIQDLPIGVSGGGADSWAWQGILADGMTVGCPPDALNTVGQDWGSPPLSPWRLRAAGYEPFIESVRATIAGAGGLRIDHVMGLFRLWWIPDGEQPTQGVYVRYPADDLLDIVCLESHRAEAVVVGEDLGTVEDGVAEALAERNIASYRVLWFEDDDPATWPPLSLAAVTTHDLPTVAGLWTGSDIDDQLASSDMAESDVRAGNAELRSRLQRDGLTDDAGVGEAVAAAYGQLGRSPSLLLALSLEDALHEERRPNVPGTTERDNWRIPLPVPVDELATSDSAGQVLDALNGSRTARPRDDA
ncbi:MAG: 4-alpha-glucanotransferase, partial [Nocardioides sp.]|nr:4-alpha-glucanotransferase [Nocardioides sp.]